MNQSPLQKSTIGLTGTPKIFDALITRDDTFISMSQKETYLLQNDDCKHNSTEIDVFLVYANDILEMFQVSKIP